MKTVILYGDLAKRFGKYHKFAANNVADVIRALRANFKEFETYMCGAHNDGVGFRVFIGGSSLPELNRIHDPVSDSDIIRIAPVLIGSGGVLKIFLGAVLITAGILLAPISGGISGGLISAGLGLVINGVATLLTSPPSVEKNPQAEKKTSYIFNGPVNSTIQGGSVPVGYGRLIIGSVIISAGIETYEEA